MSEPLIRADGIHKKFCRNLKRSIIYGAMDTSRSMFGIPYRTDQLRREEFWALSNVNLELHQGETLGVIGLNGSGKSTLLRLLNGIFPPDVGSIRVRGRIGALIAVGAGFHPNMTGRENIYLNGSILGMSRKEIDSRFDEIVEFADIGDFLEAPVSTYSSGMTVRLGFAIAVHVKPDILLVDEVLAVGDLSFINKSMRKMTEFRQQANGLIFISHNLEQVRRLCDRVIVLEKGCVVYEGPTHEGIVYYQDLSARTRINALKLQSGWVPKVGIKDIVSTGEIQIETIGVKNRKGEWLECIGTDEPLIFSCEFLTRCEIESLFFSVGVLDEDHKPCIWVMSNDQDRVKYENLGMASYELQVTIEDHHLAPGVYIPNLAIRNSYTNETYSRILPDVSFRVVSGAGQLQRGIIAVKEEWSLKKIT